MNDDTIRLVLEALIESGLWVYEARLIGPGHPAAMPSIEYVMGRIEEMTTKGGKII